MRRVPLRLGQARSARSGGEGRGRVLASRRKPADEGLHALHLYVSRDRAGLRQDPATLMMS